MVLIDNTYITATGGLSEDEKLEYGSMFDKMFQESVTGLVTNKMIGHIDLTRDLKSQKQEHADKVLEREENRDGVFNLAYKEAMRKLGFRKNAEGQYVDPQGNVIKIGESYDTEALDQMAKDIIKRKVKNSLKYGWLNNSDVERMMFEFDRGNKETAASIRFEIYRDYKEGRMSIEQWQDWNEVYMSLEIDDKEFSDYYDISLKTYKEEVKKQKK